MVDVDAVIVGCGVSGIAAAYYFGRDRYSYAILEGRDNLGGTWDLFKYPGIRSDADMYTYAFKFHPWLNAKSIADGVEIVAYLNEVVDTYGMRDKIAFGTKVLRASWSSASKTWTLETSKLTYTCRFLFLGTGYYNYTKGYMPDFPDLANYKGTVVHPQYWPSDLDYHNKRVVVVGSGATAVTIAPVIARTSRVTVLQRSPGYVVSRPRSVRLVWPLTWLVKIRFFRWLIFKLVRRFNLLRDWFYICVMTTPRGLAMVKYAILQLTKEQVPDHMQHFNPSYQPWEQRVCLTPDNEYFEAIRSGAVEMVTDRIGGFTPTGIRCESGRELEADIIVMATGLDCQAGGEIEMRKDGELIQAHERVLYKAMMLDGVPNAWMGMGYQNASWTLRIDITCEMMMRIVRHMKANNHVVCTAQSNGNIKPVPAFGLRSGYLERSGHKMPKSGDTHPWLVTHNYGFDWLSAKLFGPVTEFLKFE